MSLKQLLPELLQLPQSEKQEAVRLLMEDLEKVQVKPAANENSNSSADNDVPQAKRGGKFGEGRGVLLYMAPDFDEPLEDFAEYM